MVITLADMKRGESGVVVDIEGGHGFRTRIQNMGIRIGKRLKKIEGQHKRGPQAVLINNFKLAIGHGMSLKIFLEVNRDADK